LRIPNEIYQPDNISVNLNHSMQEKIAIEPKPVPVDKVP
jgi:hypothetical protein